MTARSRPPEPADVAAPVRGAVSVRRPIALASALLLGSTLQGAAQVPEPPPVPDPERGHVWGGCVLSEDAVAALPGVDYVVVYSRSNPNDGQALENGFTGPVICINQDTVGITAFEAIEVDNEFPVLTPESSIPGDTDPGGAATVDLLGSEEALIVQYRVNFPDSEPDEGPIEKRFCQTVAGGSECFIIFGANP